MSDTGNNPETLSISGHEDPEDEAPYAMQMVIQVEKTSMPTVTAVCEAAAVACVRLLDDPRSVEGGAWHEAVRRWEQGRIRKIVRRARASAWETAQKFDGVNAEVDGATVRAYVPGPTDEVPRELHKLQVQGLTLPDRGDHVDVETTGDVVCAAMNPRWELYSHPGKAAAQVSHAAQVSYLDMSTDRLEAWKTAGFKVLVTWPEAEAWEKLVKDADVNIVDSAFTVLTYPDTTCVAHW